MEKASSTMTPFQRRVIYSSDACQSGCCLTGLAEPMSVETGTTESLHWLIARRNREEEGCW